jgi:tetratricopeptide (TPR) repeat protein
VARFLAGNTQTYNSRMPFRPVSPMARKGGVAPASPKPAHIALQLQQGVVLHRQGKFQEARTHYETVLRHAPRNFDALHLLGVIAAQTQDNTRALELFDQALKVNPGSADAWSNRGIALKNLNRFSQALESLEKALALKPDFADAHNNRGIVLQELRRFDASLSSYDQALKLKPDFAEAVFNRGRVLSELRRFDEAINHYDRALALRPGYPDARFNKSIALLREGFYEAAWSLHESRWDVEHAGFKKRECAAPLWLGREPLDGKSILLRTEQGMGDNIQFCRYAKLLHEQGARVLLETPKPLMSLLAGLAGVDELVEIGTAPAAIDYHCPLLSLPLALNTTLATIPAPCAYIGADPSKSKAWKARLGPATKPRVGLVWSGNTLHKNDANRSLSLQLLLSHLPSECEYFSLQKEVRPFDRQALHEGNLGHYGDELHDFSDTAALCAQLDVVLSVDTSVAHLAGAMGQPTWLLLPFLPDWRWLLDRDDSPWYPTVQLFRQSESRRWEPVLARVASNLQRLAGQWSSQPARGGPEG